MAVIFNTFDNWEITNRINATVTGGQVQFTGIANLKSNIVIDDSFIGNTAFRLHYKLSNWLSEAYGFWLMTIKHSTPIQNSVQVDVNYLSMLVPITADYLPLQNFNIPVYLPVNLPAKESKIDEINFGLYSMNRAGFTISDFQLIYEESSQEKGQTSASTEQVNRLIEMAKVNILSDFNEYEVYTRNYLQTINVLPIRNFFVADAIINLDVEWEILRTVPPAYQFMPYTQPTGVAPGSNTVLYWDCRKVDLDTSWLENLQGSVALRVYPKGPAPIIGPNEVEMPTDSSLLILASPRPYTMYFVVRIVSVIRDYGMILDILTSNASDGYGWELAVWERYNIGLYGYASNPVDDIDPKEWHVVCITRNNIQAQLFVDGVLKASSGNGRNPNYGGAISINARQIGNTATQTVSFNNANIFFRAFMVFTELHAVENIATNSTWLFDEFIRVYEADKYLGKAYPDFDVEIHLWDSYFPMYKHSFPTKRTAVSQGDRIRDSFTYSLQGLPVGDHIFFATLEQKAETAHFLTEPQQSNLSITLQRGVRLTTEIAGFIHDVSWTYDGKKRADTVYGIVSMVSGELHVLRIRPSAPEGEEAFGLVEILAPYGATDGAICFDAAMSRIPGRDSVQWITSEEYHVAWVEPVTKDLWVKWYGQQPFIFDSGVDRVAMILGYYKTPGTAENFYYIMATLKGDEVICYVFNTNRMQNPYVCIGEQHIAQVGATDIQLGNWNDYQSFLAITTPNNTYVYETNTITSSNITLQVQQYNMSVRSLEMPDFLYIIWMTWKDQFTKVTGIYFERYYVEVYFEATFEGDAVIMSFYRERVLNFLKLPPEMSQIPAEQLISSIIWEETGPKNAKIRIPWNIPDEHLGKKVTVSWREWDGNELPAVETDFVWYGTTFDYRSPLKGTATFTDVLGLFTTEKTLAPQEYKLPKTAINSIMVTDASEYSIFTPMRYEQKYELSTRPRAFVITDASQYMTYTDMEFEQSYSLAASMAPGFLISNESQYMSNIVM